MVQSVFFRQFLMSCNLVLTGRPPRDIGLPKRSKGLSTIVYVDDEYSGGSGAVSLHIRTSAVDSCTVKPTGEPWMGCP